jgi:hypothetical protein
VTEEEWLLCNHWRPMLDHLGDRITRRQAMLYLCAGLRTIWKWLYSDSSREVVQIFERYVDGLATEDDLRYAYWSAEAPTFGYDFESSFYGSYPQTRDSDTVKRLIRMGVFQDADIGRVETLGEEHVRDRLLNLARAVELCPNSDGALEQRLLEHLQREKEWPSAWLVREVFGNPFRPFEMKPEWRTADVLGLARKASDDRAYDLLPILSDAMEEAGCQNFELLTHLRGEGRHVRGCWALNSILGKSSLTPPTRQMA